jgi:hypothetical protein
MATTQVGQQDPAHVWGHWLSSLSGLAGLCQGRTGLVLGKSGGEWRREIPAAEGLGPDQEGQETPLEGHPTP